MIAATTTWAQALSSGTSGRHETFTPRYGWLKKGFDRCMENPHVFNDKNAIEQLGVGKNMVKAIRFWCVLFGLLKEGDQPGSMQPTGLGRFLLDTDGGWDPYIEDPASLWMLHWQIFRPPFRAVCWNIAFSYVTLQIFTTRELSAAIRDKAAETEKIKNIAKGSIDKDASCIIRMYTPDTREQTDIRCPFTDLGLIVPALERRGKDRYRFAAGTKQTLPDWVFMASVLDFAAHWFPNQRSLALRDITFAPNSPGMAFRLSESDCGERLDRICRILEGTSFTYLNGIRQIQFSEHPMVLATRCLCRYYEGDR